MSSFFSDMGPRWYNASCQRRHYNDVVMGAIASQITSLTIVYSTVYSDADQRKHQSSTSLAFVRESHRGPMNSPHKWPVTRKMFPFDDVSMTSTKMMTVCRSTDTEGGSQNGGQFLDYLSIEFPCPKVCVFWSEFYDVLFVWVLFIIIQQWLMRWFGTEQAPKLYLNKCWPSSLMHICVASRLWVKISYMFFIRALHFIRSNCFNFWWRVTWIF